MGWPLNANFKVLQHSAYRAPVSVHIMNRHGPVFDSLSYQFTVSQHSPAGTVVGQVTAIAEFNSRSNDTGTKICDYQISPVNVPFTIDRYGWFAYLLTLYGYYYFIIPRPRILCCHFLNCLILFLFR